MGQAARARIAAHFTLQHALEKHLVLYRALSARRDETRPDERL
jgi:hypothetical protein